MDFHENGTQSTSSDQHLAASGENSNTPKETTQEEQNVSVDSGSKPKPNNSHLSFAEWKKIKRKQRAEKYSKDKVIRMKLLIQKLSEDGQDTLTPEILAKALKEMDEQRVTKHPSNDQYGIFSALKAEVMEERKDAEGYLKKLKKNEPKYILQRKSHNEKIMDSTTEHRDRMRAFMVKRLIINKKRSKKHLGTSIQTAPKPNIGGLENKECEVCGDWADGFHYGATTCSGCRDFFRRNEATPPAGNCAKHGECKMTTQTRTYCEPCRFKKCLEAGMTENASKHQKPDTQETKIAKMKIQEERSEEVREGPQHHSENQDKMKTFKTPEISQAHLDHHPDVVNYEHSDGLIQKSDCMADAPTLGRIEQRISGIDKEQHKATPPAGNCAKHGECKMTTQTRTYCQPCRFNKCLEAGMMFSSRSPPSQLPQSSPNSDGNSMEVEPQTSTKNDTDSLSSQIQITPAEMIPNTTHLNMPNFGGLESVVCEVCGDLPSGFNYRAMTCDSCKRFFRRFKAKPPAGRCFRQGKCGITVKTRNDCQPCRFKKCLKAGMYWIGWEEIQETKIAMMKIMEEHSEPPKIHAASISTEERKVASHEAEYQEMTENGNNENSMEVDPPTSTSNDTNSLFSQIRMTSVEMIPSTTHLNRPNIGWLKNNECKVCGDWADGFHYGAKTCPGCWVFFRRHKAKPPAGKCAKHGECEITVKTRKDCLPCRFKKCLKAGMDWIGWEEIQETKIAMMKIMEKHSEAPKIQATSISTEEKRVTSHKAAYREMTEKRNDENSMEEDPLTSTSNDTDSLSSQVQMTPVEMIPSTTYLNMPNVGGLENNECKVCGDWANGFHYGAMTCESCKDFFRRYNAKQETTDKCAKNGKCEMTVKTRKDCQPCRFNKCLEAGMAWNASKHRKPMTLEMKKAMMNILEEGSEAPKIQAASISTEERKVTSHKAEYREMTEKGNNENSMEVDLPTSTSNDTDSLSSQVQMTPVEMIPSTTYFNMPNVGGLENKKCKVCGDQANAFHYGALMCLGCKEFFRRHKATPPAGRCFRQGKCKITAYTRTICRPCRFKKCLEVGMISSSLMTNFRRLKNEKCEVCGDRSNGFHYGAMTCEGCKDFFRRYNAKQQTTGKCAKNGKCEITVKTRKDCQPCRFKKCLEAGMTENTQETYSKKIAKMKVLEERSEEVTERSQHHSENQDKIKTFKTPEISRGHIDHHPDVVNYEHSDGLMQKSYCMTDAPTSGRVEQRISGIDKEQHSEDKNTDGAKEIDIPGKAEKFRGVNRNVQNQEASGKQTVADYFNLSRYEKGFRQTPMTKRIIAWNKSLTANGREEQHDPLDPNLVFAGREKEVTVKPVEVRDVGDPLGVLANESNSNQMDDLDFSDDDELSEFADHSPDVFPMGEIGESEDVCEDEMEIDAVNFFYSPQHSYDHNSNQSLVVGYAVANEMTSSHSSSSQPMPPASNNDENSMEVDPSSSTNNDTDSPSFPNQMTPVEMIPSTTYLNRLNFGGLKKVSNVYVVDADSNNVISNFTAKTSENRSEQPKLVEDTLEQSEQTSPLKRAAQRADISKCGSPDAKRMKIVETTEEKDDDCHAPSVIIDANIPENTSSVQSVCKTSKTFIKTGPILISLKKLHSKIAKNENRKMHEDLQNALEQDVEIKQWITPFKYTFETIKYSFGRTSNAEEMGMLALEIFSIFKTVFSICLESYSADFPEIGQISELIEKMDDEKDGTSKITFEILETIVRIWCITIVR